MNAWTTTTKPFTQKSRYEKLRGNSEMWGDKAVYAVLKLPKRDAVFRPAEKTKKSLFCGAESDPLRDQFLGGSVITGR